MPLLNYKALMLQAHQTMNHEKITNVFNKSSESYLKGYLFNNFQIHANLHNRNQFKIHRKYALRHYSYQKQ